MGEGRREMIDWFAESGAKSEVGERGRKLVDG